MENTIEQRIVDAAVKVINTFSAVNQNHQIERLMGERGLALQRAVADLRHGLRVAGHEVEPVYVSPWAYGDLIAL